jgi:peroxidase
LRLVEILTYNISSSSNLTCRFLLISAQFLDHDITLTPVHRGPEEKILNCRDCESQKETHPECWPIPVPSGDTWYPERALNEDKPYCIPFTRSLPGQQRLGPREQINQNSAYIDASQIYGENVCKAESLRGAGGKLNATLSTGLGGKALMPQTGTLKECRSPSGYCFYAGDPRASEQPALASVHTMFLRQHNNWADGMKAVNPHWGDEKIYQEVCKKIAIAMLESFVP